MTTIIKHYLTNIEQALKAGNATEHTHRPALQALLEALDLSIRATNEPKQIACGAPDYVITRNGLTLGYIEAKDVGKSLDQTARSEQLKRYRRSLENLLLTDYLEFRWYVEGELRETARLARWENGKLKIEKNGSTAVEALLDRFLGHSIQEINTPQDLAVRMARLAHMIRDIIVEAYQQDQVSNLLHGWRQAFAEVLIADLGEPEKTGDFADMVAQTLAYGLFSARVMASPSVYPRVGRPPSVPPPAGEGESEASGRNVATSVPPYAGRGEHSPSPREGKGLGDGVKTFTRYEAQQLIPKSNPFLRKFFARITSIELDDEPFAPFVDDLVNLLAHTDMAAVLADFGRRTRQEDPVVHFYETFLAAYDPKLREARGVYYTPEPVVSYIVRSVDHLLKTRFGCPQGLADSSIITVPNYDPALKTKDGKQVRKTTESHKVLILDPATGTGTFLYAVIDFIRQQFMQQGNAGMWPGYVKQHLLPRLFGFELLMAPYAVAHFKLSLQLEGADLPEAQRERWRYTFADHERLGIYLTNTLAEAHELTGLPLFTQWVADETNAANRVKKMLPVLVVMGNPPYAYESSNTGPWISQLIKNYYKLNGKPLNERNPKGLQDDYVKFIRFGQWRVEQTGTGILAFITNHGYLNNPTFRGMRWSLLETFDEIYLLDLHGSTKRQETTPRGAIDENVFDIQQGVAIGIFVKHPDKKNKQAKVFHYDLFGSRKRKQDWLYKDNIDTTEWNEITPFFPFFLFVPQTIDLLDEYDRGWKITDVFPIGSVGISTSRDKLTIQFSEQELLNLIENFAKLPENEARQKFRLGKDSRDWKISLAQEDLKQSKIDPTNVYPILYRVFDIRHTYYTGHSRGFQSMPRPEVSQHMIAGKNLMLCTNRQVNNYFQHAFVSRRIIDGNAVSLASRERTYGFPLYLYPTDDASKQKSLFDISPWPADDAHGGRVPNLNPDFVAEMEEKLGLKFVPFLPPSIPPHAGGGEGEAPGRNAVTSVPPYAGGDERSPSPREGKGLGDGVKLRDGVKSSNWHTPPDLWQKLKPLARQMRREATPAEKKLWQRLRGKQLGLKFRRQHAIDRFIVDFYCHDARLIIEVDGPIHDYTPEEDAVRQEFLESRGFTILRFSNEQIETSIGSVLERIRQAISSPSVSPQADTPPSIPPQAGGGEGEASGRNVVTSVPPYAGEGEHSPSPREGKGLGDGVKTFTPEDIFHYIYAIFHSPTYRERYAEFLKIDFPRVPLTSDVALFWQLVDRGAKLVGLHLLESPQVNQLITSYPVPGDNRVEKGYPKYAPPKDGAPGRVRINKRQYFEGVPPEVWEFYVGGYQVPHKWLKDRRGRQLTFDDLLHYQRVVVALQETIRLMDEIDAAIPDWPVA